jgi:hypothetical protein
LKHAYTIQVVVGRKVKKLHCASAWVAFEQHNRLIRKGLKVLILDRAGEPVTIGRLEAAAQAETGAAVTATAQPGGLPISARNLLMGL